MISEKLLSAVMGAKILNIMEVDEYSNLRFNYVEQQTEFGIEADFQEVNIYELANKCKELALSMGYDLLSGYGDFKSKRFLCHIYCKKWKVAEFKRFNAETEPEAIFKACEWAVENKR